MDTEPEVRMYRSCGNWGAVGWYYRIGQGSPVGPFENTVSAGLAVQKALLAAGAGREGE